MVRTPPPGGSKRLPSRFILFSSSAAATEKFVFLLSQTSLGTYGASNRRICLDETAGRKLQKCKKCELYCAEEQLLLAQTLWKAAASQQKRIMNKQVMFGFRNKDFLLLRVCTAV